LMITTRKDHEASDAETVQKAGEFDPDLHWLGIIAPDGRRIRWDEKAGLDGMLYAPKLSTCFKHKR
jgi:hypothetical protein